MNTLPLITVIVPAHNNAATLPAALDSILAQTYRNIEILVIDDHSTDDTLKIAERYAAAHPNVRAFALPVDDPKRINRRGRNVNAGYSARNFGLSQASGEWITFQDADDASLPNRIDAQYNLAQKYGVEHICLQWQQLTPDRIGCTFDVETALARETGLITTSKELIRLARRTQGILMRLLGPLRRFVPFEVKRARVLNKLFFGSLDSYPGTGNSPLFTRAIAERVKFRQSDARVWPSFTGRGADRDFNFQVALLGKSACVAVPLYLYRVDRENDLGYDPSPYMQCP